MLRTLRSRGRAACAATVLATLTLTAYPAAAAATGRLTLYSDTAFSQPVKSVTYSACEDFVGYISGQRVGSFDNSPLPGCRVVLHAVSGNYTLCAGRAVVPQAYRQTLLYSIGAGSTAPCPV